MDRITALAAFVRTVGKALPTIGTPAAIGNAAPYSDSNHAEKLPARCRGGTSPGRLGAGGPPREALSPVGPSPVKAPRLCGRVNT